MAGVKFFERFFGFGERAVSLCLALAMMGSSFPALRSNAETRQSLQADGVSVAGGMVVLDDLDMAKAAIGQGAEVLFDGEKLVIRLKEDIVLSKPLMLSKSESKTEVVINLNDHTLTAEADNDAVMMHGNFNLTVNGGNEERAMAGSIIGGAGSVGRNGQGAISFVENNGPAAKEAEAAVEYPVITLQHGANVIGGQGGDKSLLSIGEATYKITNPGKKVGGKIKGATLEYAKVNKFSSEMFIPNTIETDGVQYKVTSISTGVFKNSKELKKVSIGGYVKAIGKEAFFGCTNLGSVYFGSEITSIGNDAFKNCKKLKEVRLGKRLPKSARAFFVGAAN